MIGVLLASKEEWNVLLNVYNISEDYLEKYPYGEFYRTNFNGKDIVFYRSGARKINAAASTQYMIDRFSLEKVIIIGTCTAVNDSYDYNDILIPNKIIDYDYVIRELSFNIDDSSFIELPEANISLEYVDGILGSSDKALVMWKDLTYLASVGIDASDMESYAVCKVCMNNNIGFNIIKGISDRPMKSENGYDEQLEVYEENTPIVMKKVIEDYLPEVL
ncbi:MAG: hypothetical protein J6J17_01415 [Bacilli bacterium]|nr:hypothetical protein [Bacilli bacterium]